MIRRRLSQAGPLVGLAVAAAVVALGQWLAGGRLRTLLQIDAAVVVLGGTAAALFVSYPMPTLKRALAAARSTLGTQASPAHDLIARFTQYAVKTRRRGVLAIESELPKIQDPFLNRALGLVIDGATSDDVQLLMRAASRTIDDGDEESAEVFEAAAGYSPTLGILGAVIGLIHVMENLAAPSRLGAGIAVAFVSTVYGVGAANLIFLPLATRLRGLARDRSLARDIVIEGAIAIQRGMHPRLVETHLAGFLRAADKPRGKAA